MVSTKASTSAAAAGSGKREDAESASNVRADKYTGPLLALLITCRVAAALWSNISDCDETYNYWEPMHYLVHGTGFQTWEYSPLYALRSYAYLNLHAVIVTAAQLIGLSKIGQFYALRLFLALFTAAAEWSLYQALRRTRLFAALSLPHLLPTPALYLVFSSLSCGMFISSAAFLPSSFAMATATLALAAWLRGSAFLAVLWTAVGGIVGWPFAAALGVPIAIDALFIQRNVLGFVKACFVALALVLVPLVAIDSFYYGRPVIAPLNIVLYNVLSSETGSELYGTEPWTFYFINGALNFNIVFSLALISPWVVGVHSLVTRNGKQFWTALAATSSMWIWLAIFVPQPHKEERFLFPIYPVISLAAAVTFSSAAQLLSHVTKGHRLGRFLLTQAQGMTLALFILLCGSRIAALYNNYHAPLEVYRRLDSQLRSPSQPTSSPSVCVGKEWYRFPSSFFLPEQARLEFIESEFKGLLPKHYDAKNGTRGIPSHMNHLNKEERTRYVYLASCDFLVDLEVEATTPLEKNFGRSAEWEMVECVPFLDAAATPSGLSRSLYVPQHLKGLLQFQPTLGQYCVYKRRK